MNFHHLLRGVSGSTSSGAAEPFAQVVGVAHDGPEALSVADHLRPEIAPLDIGLPVMNGYELAVRLRDRGHSPRFIAVTGYGEESDRARSKALGFMAHLVKPVDLETLADRLPGGRSSPLTRSDQPRGAGSPSGVVR